MNTTDSYILELDAVSKKFPNTGFHLNNVSFKLPYGSIMGFVGENGAGKTTTIRCILKSLQEDSGQIKMFGKELTDNSVDIKEKIGVVFDASNFSSNLSPLRISNIMRHIYTRWDDTVFFRYLDRFQLPTRQKVGNFSKGMTMKLALAVAISHAPMLLILDEVTSGLDPVVREDILDVFLEFVQDEQHAVFLSSHITSDLEKVSDYVTFIHKGEIILASTKDELLDNYGVLRCREKDFNLVDAQDYLAYRKRELQIDLLVPNITNIRNKYKDLLVDNATIDDVLLLLTKGVHV